jgi:HAD superfamily hydrolase (TIGR01490 family)
MAEAVKRKFAVFDIDGTVIRWQLYHAIVNELGKQGVLSPEVAKRIRTARLNWKTRDSQDSFREYEHVLVQEYLTALTQITVVEHKEAVERVFELYKDQVYTYTRDLIKKLQAEGYLLFAISGSQQDIVSKLGDYYGFDEVVGSNYEVVDGRFTGIEESPVHSGKRDVLQKLMMKHQVDQKGSIGVGDTGGDIGMLELVEQPIAFNPNRDLYNTATERNWTIVLERKNVVYTLQSDGAQHYTLAK